MSDGLEPYKMRDYTAWDSYNSIRDRYDLNSDYSPRKGEETK